MPGPWEKYQQQGRATARPTRAPVAARTKPTRSDLLRATAQEGVRTGQVGTGSKGFDAFSAGVRRNLFGIPERLSAAYDYWIGGGPGKSYDEALELQRAITDAQWNQNKTAGIAGSILGAVGGGGVLTKGISTGGNILAKVAGSGVPARVVRTAGELLAASQKLQKGKRLVNAGKLAVTGGTGGALQAAGEGGDVTTGATLGTLGGAATPYIGNVLAGAYRKVARPFSSNAGKALREVVEQAPDDIEQALSTLETRTGRPQALASVLSPRDAAVVRDQIIRNSPEAAAAVRENAGNAIEALPNAMRAHVERAGATAGAEDTTLAKLAQRQEGDMNAAMGDIGERTYDVSKAFPDELQRDIISQLARRTPAIADRFATQQLPEGFSTTNPLTGEIGQDVSQWWDRPTQLTLREIDSLRRSLGKMETGSAGSNPLNSQDFGNARKSLTEFARGADEDYAAALDRYARQGDKISGYDLAASGNRAGNLDDTQLIRNVTSPEGLAGQAAGAMSRVRSQVGASPGAAARMASELGSGGNLTRPGSGLISEQLGDAASGQLREASKAEGDAIRTMLKNAGVDVASDKPEKFDDPEVLSTIGAVLSGNALITTKARFLNILLARTPINEQTAAKVADMLFDPNQSAQALKFLRAQNFNSGAAIKAALAGGNLTASATTSAPRTPEGTAPDADLPNAGGDLPAEAPPAQEAAPWEQFAGQGGQESSYNLDLSDEAPEFQDLFDRVINQESGGQQFDQSGQPLASSAGAIGVAQVMPGTAPDAAALAGVPWDENAYLTDPEYNKTLGAAYLKEMLRSFGGNVPMALAAYNAGPGAVMKAVAKGQQNWLAYLPAETQNYVESIGS